MTLLVVHVDHLRLLDPIALVHRAICVFSNFPPFLVPLIIWAVNGGEVWPYASRFDHRCPLKPWLGFLETYASITKTPRSFRMWITLLVFLWRMYDLSSSKTTL